MKQHISTEQLDSLSEQGKLKLREFGITHCQREGSMWAYWPYRDLYPDRDPEWQVTPFSDDSEYGHTSDEITDTEWRKELYPLPNIGEMIEFLLPFYSGNGLPMNQNGINWWCIATADEDGIFEKGIQSYQELCDALWNACKQILGEVHESVV